MMAAHAKAIEWIGGVDGTLRLLDQTRLPGEVAFVECGDLETVFEAIVSLRVRGAPAIGIAAAMGVVVAARNSDDLDAAVGRAVERLAQSRPTAVNLFWALDRMNRRLQTARGSRDERLNALLVEAKEILAEDERMCAAIGRFGAALMPQSGGVLTHCNAGALATSDHGTALSVIYSAVADGKQLHVFADETRPLLQGSRLTAWELVNRGVPTTLICDNMAGMVMKQGKVQAVVVGADRIAANGDTANKIGTYSVAVLAKAHGIPFYVAAPYSTFDASLADGSLIPIEERAPSEITRGMGKQTAPDDVGVYNPAFDVTPHEYIAAFVTDRGVIRPPYRFTS